MMHWFSIPGSRWLILGCALGSLCSSAMAQSMNLTPQQLEQLMQVLPRVSGQPAVVDEAPQLAPGQGDASLVSPVLAEIPAETDGPPTLEPLDTLVIQVTLSVNPGGITPLLTRLRRGNPYRLDKFGVLELPSVPPIELSGLTIEEATLRLSTEPALADFDVAVTELQLDRTDAYSVPRFGYDLFRGAPTTFMPATSVPMPTEYGVGPGDVIQIDLYGTRDAQYRLVVNRNGMLNFPGLGPISVIGLDFESLREEILLRVRNQMMGVEASVTLEALRSIRVFVLGDVERPGSYTVSGLSTITNALFLSGGIREIGSLRRVELKRGGQTISTLDLYDLLLRGDTRADARLEQGDAIFVPPVGKTVAVVGEVKRPAIYELREELTLAEALSLAGGTLPTASLEWLKVERQTSGQGITVQDVGFDDARAEMVQDGDFVRVLPITEQFPNSLDLSGHVNEPGRYEWRSGMRLADLLPSSAHLKPRFDPHYVLIRREIEPNGRIEVLTADLEAAWENPGSAADLELQRRDTVHIFRNDTGRGHIVSDLIDELESQQASEGLGLAPFATVEGAVPHAGNFPIEKRGMRISDLLRASGGLDESAHGLTADLLRHSVVQGRYEQEAIIKVDLAGILAGNAEADLQVTPHDRLTVRPMPRWAQVENVLLGGEIVFSGNYSIRRGETLRSLLLRAGGLTEDAFPEGSVFLREALREREQQTIDALAVRMERDLLSRAASATEEQSGQIESARAVLAELRDIEATGRLVIDLNEIIAGTEESDIILRDNDQLLVPSLQASITVVGEVQYPSSHNYRRGLDSGDYIARSGGLTSNADLKRIYIVRANGSVELPGTGSSFFMRNKRTLDIRPADTVVVPLKLRRLQPVVFWSNATQIIYNLSIATAAIRAFR